MWLDLLKEWGEDGIGLLFFFFGGRGRRGLAF